MRIGCGDRTIIDGGYHGVIFASITETTYLHDFERPNNQLYHLWPLAGTMPSMDPWCYVGEAAELQTLGL